MYEDAAEESKIKNSVATINFDSFRDLDTGDGLEPSESILKVRFLISFTIFIIAAHDSQYGFLGESMNGKLG